MARTKLLSCLLLLAVSQFSSSVRAADLKSEFAKMVKAYDNALINGDQKALEALYDNDGEFVLPDGLLVDKKEYVASSITRTWETAETSEQTIREITDSTVIETGTFAATGKEENGQSFSERTRYTAVWVKRDGKWLMTAEQSTPIAGTK